MFSQHPPAILHTVHSLRPSSGGPSRTIPPLCAAVARTERFRVCLLTTRHPDEPNTPVDRDLVTTIELPWSRRSWTPQLKRAFEAEIVKLHQEYGFAVIHDHGQWLATNRAAASAAS